MGTLWRWTTNANRYSTNFQTQNTLVQRFQRIADNVVHLRIVGVTNGVAVPPGGFLTNADLPTHVAIELGYVDGKTADRARSMGSSGTVSYLSTNVDSVHLFRLQIPIRNGQQ